MKRIALVLLILLAACQAPTDPALEQEPTDLSLQGIINEFEALDNTYNTNWQEERIPDNIIRLDAIEPWTKRLTTLQDRLDETSAAYQLIDARLAMLESQLALYLREDYEHGDVTLVKEDDEYVVSEILNCDNVPDIINANNLYVKSYNAYFRFFNTMDDLLQTSPDAQQLIGVDNNRLAFYDSPFSDIEKQVKAIEDAIIMQCAGKTVTPQSDEA